MLRNCFKQWFSRILAAGFFAKCVENGDDLRPVLVILQRKPVPDDAVPADDEDDRQGDAVPGGAFPELGVCDAEGWNDFRPGVGQ